MAIQTSSEGFILVTLSQRPHLGHELERINEIACDGCNYDVLIDFSSVQILTSASICNLLLLRELLIAVGHQVFLCSVSLPVKCIFIRLGLETLFEFADDRFGVLETVAQHRHKN